MKKTSVRISVKDLRKINDLVVNNEFTDASDFIRKAIKYLLAYLDFEVEPTLGFSEDDKG